VSFRGVGLFLLKLEAVLLKLNVRLRTPRGAQLTWVRSSLVNYVILILYKN